ncbi:MULTISPECIES: EamA family transporter [unclassified Pseudomonas]|uniref:EamA family transporter n=1 Tax=unclassified Pseudomonas TaxID=196821 RepID=UPI00381BC61B
MAVSGIAWGCYSVLGKCSESPARATAGNFMRNLPPMVAVAAIGLAQVSLHITAPGAIYSAASGVLASGAGYVMWYAVVKRLHAQTAATLQFSVPVLASIAGVILLSEPHSSRMVAASLIVLEGIAFALLLVQNADIGGRTRRKAFFLMSNGHNNAILSYLFFLIIPVYSPNAGMSS